MNTDKTRLENESRSSCLSDVMPRFLSSLKEKLSRFFCKHNYLWVRNVYGDEIYMTGKFKRSWWKCDKCGKCQSRERLNTSGRS